MIFKKTTLNFLRSLVALCMFCFAFGIWQSNHAAHEAQKEGTKLEEPSDYFFLQRAYPEKNFSQNTYLRAMEAAQRQVLERTEALVGVDANWRTEGPGNLGARVNAVAVHPTNENIIYVGFSGGGIFKTTDGGANWNPIFDAQAYLSISDIILDPQNPEIVYVGTGDVNISGYPFVGNGVFRSKNGGQTWTNIGLNDQKIISKIKIHPTNSNIIYAACMGNPFVRDNKRGVYKTVNGGASWSQVLFISDQTGIVDLLLNPSNPNILYAAGWDRIRNNSESVLSGTGAKVYKTTMRCQLGGFGRRASDNGTIADRLSYVGSKSEYYFCALRGYRFRVE